MLKRMTVGLLTLAICATGLSCAVQPPADGGNGGGDGGGDGGGSGDGGGGAIADFIGALTVTYTHTYSAAGEQESLVGGAAFSTVEDVVNDNIQTKSIGDCVVTTIAVDATTPGDGAPTVDPLDAGLAGLLSTTTAETALTKFAEGIYATGEISGGDFVTGDTYTFAFDGGTDIAGFMTSIDLPAAFTSTTPDLSDDTLTVDKTAALDVTWAPNGVADSVIVQVSAANMDTFVSIVCTVDDTGSATVPQAAMECLLDSPTSTTVSISRTNSNDIETDLTDLTDGGSGTLYVTAQTGVARTIIAGGDTGGVNPCDFIPCPEGTTCNPLTFTCE